MVRAIDLLTAITVLSLLATPALGDDALKRELVEQVSEMKPPVLARYQELDLMHKQILITLQTLPENQITPTTRKWVNLAAGQGGILQKFDEINDLASKGNPQSHETALTKATTLKSDINTLEGYEQAKENFITIYPKMALIHLFTDQGVYFEELAENENNTRLSIDYYKQALIAYREAEDLTKTTYVDLKVKELGSEYRFDMEIANESLYLGEANFERTMRGLNNSTSLISVVAGILSARTSERELTTVYEIYVKHGDEQASRIDEMLVTVGDAHTELVDIFLIYAAVFGALFIVILVVALSRLFRWTHAVEDTVLGNEVIG
ncbi:MAG TPA: hypothetical protein EYP67_07855 [Methanosarcinales archaeon]|nr:hypothetical protein [Methanosarcinales archaeon]